MEIVFDWWGQAIAPLLPKEEGNLFVGKDERLACEGCEKSTAKGLSFIYGKKGAF
ncbi:MAG: hypothetical protein LBP26_00145 [Clostridiales bacterium]|nr:hypothetical protein [Clostridiales bacterium]